MSRMFVGEVMADGTVVRWEPGRPTSVEVHAADGRRLHGDEAAAVLVEVQERRDARRAQHSGPDMLGPHPLVVGEAIERAKAQAARDGHAVSIEEMEADTFLADVQKVADESERLIAEAEAEREARAALDTP